MAIEKIARHAGHATETVYRQELRPDLHDGEVMDRFFGGVNSDQGYQLAVPDAERRQRRQRLGLRRVGGGERQVVLGRGGQTHRSDAVLGDLGLAGPGKCRIGRGCAVGS
jgi:hypothetical protein